MGSALYPTLPLLNHSCKPNTLRFNQGHLVVVMATEDIPKGSEVSDSYGLVHYITNEKVERQTVLKTRFNFECQCIACVQVLFIFVSLLAAVDMDFLRKLLRLNSTIVIIIFHAASKSRM